MVVPILRLLVSTVIVVATLVVTTEGYRQWRQRRQENPQRRPSTSRRNNQVRPLDEPPQTNCIICDELLGIENITTLPCQHKFHKDCYLAFQITRNVDHKEADVCAIVNCRDSNF